MKKYAHIAQILRQRVTDGQYTDRLPTERELMEEFGVSRVTVRKSFEVLQQELPLRRSKKGGTHLLAPQPTKTGKRQLVLLMPNSTEESIEIITGVESYFSRSGLSLTVKFTDLSVKSERVILEELLELDIAGFLIYPAATTANRDMFLGIMERGIPLVFIDRSPSRITCSSVSINNQQVAMDVVNFLYEQGHRQIAFFAAGLKAQQSTMERLWGFSYAMSRHGLPVTKENLYAFEDPEEMWQCFDRFFASENKPTSVFCSDDVLAMYFIHAALQRGYRVPED
ncbi:MAG: substrate-binding domain-containing protein, partial [Clostridia bacterium]|nr:substrate-binding domain-containing protein [Clostridia bacterium]